MAEGEFVLLRQHLEAAVSAAVSLRGLPCSDLDLYTMLADAAAQQRDLATLRAYAPRAATLAERDGHVLYQAIAQRALATVCRLEGNAAAAKTRLQQALDLLRALGTPWQVARTQVELGELARSDWATSTVRAACSPWRWPASTRSAPCRTQRGSPQRCGRWTSVPGAEDALGAACERSGHAPAGEHQVGLSMLRSVQHPEGTDDEY